MKQNRKIIKQIARILNVSRRKVRNVLRGSIPYRATSVHTDGAGWAHVRVTATAMASPRHPSYMVGIRPR